MQSEIVETLAMHVVVEAGDEVTARNLLTLKILDGIVDLIVMGAGGESVSKGHGKGTTS